MQNTISVREIQRNYRKLINQVKRTKQPIFLGAYFKPEAVLLDVPMFEAMGRAKPKKTWKEIKAVLGKISQSGKQKVNLAKFIHEDRQAR